MLCVFISHNLVICSWQIPAEARDLWNWILLFGIHCESAVIWSQQWVFNLKVDLQLLSQYKVMVSILIKVNHMLFREYNVTQPHAILTHIHFILNLIIYLTLFHSPSLFFSLANGTSLSQSLCILNYAYKWYIYMYLLTHSILYIAWNIATHREMSCCIPGNREYQ